MHEYENQFAVKALLSILEHSLPDKIEISHAFQSLFGNVEVMTQISNDYVSEYSRFCEGDPELFEDY